MTVDLRLEQLYQRVELVKGIGDPRLGKLCIMSFAALLSGEAHCDSPSVASPVIRRFAIPINDRMPASFRQRLKPFAPRIIGTRDRLDALRAEALATAVRDEIVPRMHADFRPVSKGVAWLYGFREVREAARTLVDLLDATSGVHGIFEVPELQIEIAAATAELLTRGARAASQADTAAWYWNKAIDLLDRLCDIGGERAEPRIDAIRVAWLEAVLARRERLARHTALANRALERLRQLLPLRSDAA
ncbi:hypothetical protein [Acidiphilium sp.]|uniref:hypothetical protein n=1 Tax=Acidiphilium sp. TaxID=527 RepID=UPI002327C8C5|nr:hypothetical protein [Acidiphilium sp.]MDA8248548.1 hypothetical protein [Rhodospirillales bacterium]